MESVWRSFCSARRFVDGKTRFSALIVVFIVVFIANDISARSAVLGAEILAAIIAAITDAMMAALISNCCQLRMSGNCSELVNEFVPVAVHNFFELFDVALCGLGKLGSLIGDPTDQHGFVAVERNGEDFRIVQIAVIDTSAHSVRIQANDEVEHGCAIGDIDLLGGVFGPHCLLGEEETSLIALFVLQEREWLEILHGDTLLAGKRIVS